MPYLAVTAMVPTMDYAVQCMNTVAMVGVNVLTMHSSGWLSRTTTLAWCVRD